MDAAQRKQSGRPLFFRKCTLILVAVHWHADQRHDRRHRALHAALTVHGDRKIDPRHDLVARQHAADGDVRTCQVADIVHRTGDNDIGLARTRRTAGRCIRSASPGRSHQNAKRIAGRLARKGMLRMVRDKADGGVKRLAATSAGSRGWECRNESHFRMIGQWFSELSRAGQKILRQSLEKLAQSLGE